MIPQTFHGNVRDHAPKNSLRYALENLLIALFLAGVIITIALVGLALILATHK